MMSKGTWLFRCQSCGFMRSNLAAGGAALGEGFEEFRRRNFELLLDRLESVVPLHGKHLLEVGCGRGWFLEAAAARGANVCGIEPGPDFKSAKAAGFTAYNGFFPHDLPPREKFDLIVFNDVFEHIPEPVAAIKDVEERLNPGGYALLNLPSSDGVFFKIASALARAGIAGPFDRMWQRGLASPHMSYFNPQNLQRLVAQHTSMKPVFCGVLPSLGRSGLRDRVKITMPGWRGDLLAGAVYMASFALPLLPADIAVVIFERRA